MSISWRPTAPLANLRLRAEILAAIRCFFAERHVMEVETPLIGSATATDPHLCSIPCVLTEPGDGEGVRRFLQTSPELAMKRLLAAGSGPIFQICKAFRQSEVGRLHNPEFTILEWYRPGFDHHQLMDEVDELLGTVLGTTAGERLTYNEAFQNHAEIDPHQANDEELRQRAQQLVEAPPDLAANDRDGWLDLLLTHVVEPYLGRGQPTFVHDFPATQAALARIRPGSPALAERFEVYVEGIELANGYHELTDPAEQRRRFEADLETRRAFGLPEVAADERLLEALEHGLPDCAGVALGVDRLTVLAAGTRELRDVIAFPVERA